MAPSLLDTVTGTDTDRSIQSSWRMSQRLWKQDASKNAPPPPIDGDGVRAACDDSLEEFLRRMFPEAFPLAFSPTHIRMISEIQRATDEGGLKAIAAPRGTGKTSILLRAGAWAIFTGRRRYVCIVASDEASANGNLLTIKNEIAFNENLAKYYGRETWCLRQIDMQPQRSSKQHWEGTRTGVRCEKSLIDFGTIPDCVTSGAVITSVGITGRLRGQQSLTLTGEIIRPDFLLVDDPSTKVSAASVSMNAKRHSTMMSDCLGLAGPGVAISGFCSCTVIYKDDLADRLLDRSVSPDWNGDRVQMIEKWPTWMEGWQEYNQIRVEELQDGSDSSRSTQFVRDNYDRLHEDAQVYWEDRKSDSDVSALHHAMNLYFRDPAAFASEYQNAPMDEGLKPPFELNANKIARRVGGLGRAQVPDDVDKITAFIDVQNELLYYAVVAWTDKGRGYVIDYGAAPDQARYHWTKANVQTTLAMAFGDEFETYIRTGVEWLVEAILTNEYRTENGALVNVDKLLIDGRWGESTKTIRDTVKESKHRSRIHVSMGMYYGATSKKWQQLKKEPLRHGQKKRNAKGIHAKFIVPDGGGHRELFYDTNYWKSLCAERLVCSIGSPKAIVLFNAKPHVHLMFGEHAACEDPIRVTGKETTVTEWKQPLSGSTENDYWDCLVGNAALASTLGVDILEGNKRSGRGNMTKALEQVLKSKRPDQIFKTR